MSRFFLIIFLLALVGVTFTYSLLYGAFNLLPPQNPLNQNLRPRVLTNYYLRQVFRLNQTGDAREDYAQAKIFKKLEITVYYPDRRALSTQTIQQTVSEMKKVVDKPVGIIVSEKYLASPVTGPTTDEQLAHLLDNYPADFSPGNGTATLRIFVLDQYAKMPSFVGLVKEADSLFLFLEPARKLVGTDNSPAKVEASTILHEFGHLLGAEHVADKDCVLFEKVEGSPRAEANAFTDKYCPLDIGEIRRALEEK